MNKYSTCLEAKLYEEVHEFHESKDPEELADILEVTNTLVKAYGCSKQKLMEIYNRKHTTQGGFAKRVFLIRKTKN